MARQLERHLTHTISPSSPYEPHSRHAARTRDRYHLNSSSQVVLMPPHMVKGRVEPIS